MNKLNEKIQSSFDTDLDRAQVMGNYGYNTTTSKWNRLNTDGAGALNVNVHGGSTGSGDLKARTTITDPSSSTFLKCNPDGSLELTAELDTSSLAKETKQDTMITDLTQIATNTSRLAPQLNRTEAIPVQIMVGSGGANYDALRANGQDLMVMVDDMNPDVALNSGLSTATNQTNGTQLSRCMGIDTATSLQHQLKVASDGALHIISENFDSMLIKGVEDGTSTQRDCRQNANGDLRSALIGNTAKDGTGTNYYVLVDSDGKLETSGGGGGSSASNQYNNGATEETLSVVAPTAPATGLVTPAVTILDMTNYKGLAMNITTTSATYFDISVGVEFSNVANFATTLGVAYSDIQNFNTAIDVGGNPIASRYIANILMTPEYNSQQPQARYARATFNHNNNFGSDISVVINTIQMPF